MNDERSAGGTPRVRDADTIQTTIDIRWVKDEAQLIECRSDDLAAGHWRKVLVLMKTDQEGEAIQKKGRA